MLLIGHPSTRVQRYVAAGVLQAALTLELPIRLTPLLPPGFLQAVSENLDRLLAVATFIYISYLWTRLKSFDLIQRD